MNLKKEILEKILVEHHEHRSEYLRNDVEENLQGFVKMIASMHSLGPGPGSSYTHNEYNEKMRTLITLFDELYEEMAKV